MRQKLSIEISEAEAAGGACAALAREMGLRVSIAVVDDVGALVHFSRLDGARPYSVDLAIRKARTAAALALPTKVVEEITRERPMQGVDMLAVSGGAPIMVEGVCAGAIGVSGAKGEEDHEIALAGAVTLSTSP
ncbi:MAG TPA: heme-binding protein [Caulobacteraceae bacterium]|nr:heme-binding protein [Caulobacteraceae bacterium]